ncbi:ornithine carbamoyltransferase [candidate division WOR-3 bacterium]|uniref:Ornithine carbamoyltransferase n=1 Tax=candidate division WOR-3 bacterium TaxID=2052148 RepID=A0A660SDH5_UNCW3|nr:MAG: ornithine carbamoyltransferase [candidate division WOR-3 bacterium]
MKRDLISIGDLSREEILAIFRLARELKEKRREGKKHELLPGFILAMIFEKPSLRTRVTFETGIEELGGHGIYLAPADIQLGKRESVGDVARNLSRWVHLIMARTFAHQTIIDLARAATIPVINGLSDEEHPCQVLGDLFTISEKVGDLGGTKIAWVGDGNNVCNSLILGTALLGLELRVATPEGYEPKAEIIKRAEELGRPPRLFHDPEPAVVGADFIYTDVWTSMGREEEAEKRRKVFAPFQVNRDLLAHAPDHCRVMHCLPAHRGEEITDEVIDSKSSIVLDQAENRLHIQKGLMVWLSRPSGP